MQSSSTAKDAIWMACVATCLKLLLVHSYHSTDFEVHRHWMAITHSLPMNQWYLDETSQWTLDYPPFFAWFERTLAFGAAFVDPTMVDLKGGIDYASSSTVLYQRGSVMLSDSLLVYATWRICRHMSRGRFLLVMSAVLFSPGLLLVDHIHFQYNGFLLGLLLLSLAMMQEKKYVSGAALFAALVCMKHLFAVAGPLFFVFLLSNHCWGPHGMANFVGLGITVGLITGLAFGPFAYFGQIPALLSRLFPFGRGLLHSYWAPNLWALYAAADKMVTLGFRASHAPQAAFTGGLVGDSSPFSLLPAITPRVALSLVLLSMLPCLVRVWRLPIRSSEPNPIPNLIRWVAYVYACGFLFGWHVHEKASLHFAVPFALLGAESRADARLFFFMSAVSTYSLFPLLFHAKEYPIKVAITILYLLGMHHGTAFVFDSERGDGKSDVAVVGHHRVNGGGRGEWGGENKTAGGGWKGSAEGLSFGCGWSGRWGGGESDAGGERRIQAGSEREGGQQAFGDGGGGEGRQRTEAEVNAVHVQT